MNTNEIAMFQPATLPGDVVDVYTNSSLYSIISGWLLCDGVAIADKQVVIKVNGTVVCSVEASDDGSYSTTLNLEPVDNKPTNYQVEVVFYGDDALNLTGLATSPDGTEYAFCTTFQYFGYKPPSNTAMLTVEPASTQITASSSITETEDGVEIAPPKTPEEMEQEAKDEGWLRVEPRFSWWYPWFRLHFVGEHNGENIIDVGVAMLPFADFGFFPDTLLKAEIDYHITDLPGLLITGMIMGEIALWAAGNIGPWAFIPAVIIYITYKLVTFGQIYDSVEKLWEFLVGNFLSLVVSALTGLKQFLPSTLQSLAAGAASLKNWAFAFIYKCITVPLTVYLLMATWDRLVALGAV